VPGRPEPSTTPERPRLPASKDGSETFLNLKSKSRRPAHPTDGDGEQSIAWDIIHGTRPVHQLHASTAELTLHCAV